MRCKQITLTVVLAVAGLALPGVPTLSRAWPVESACLGPDQFTSSLVSFMQEIVTGTDSAMVVKRARYGLPKIDSSLVTTVTDSATCRAYGDALSRALNANSPAPGRRVYVVQVGTTRVVVSDPNDRLGEWTGHVVFDTTYHIIAAFAG